MPSAVRRSVSRGQLALALLLAFCACHARGQAAPAQPAAQPTLQPLAGATSVQIDNTLSTSKPDDIQVPEANPARPTITNPAHIPPVGYLQFEQGALLAFSSPAGLAHQYGLVQTTKLAVHPRLLLQFQSQPVAFSRVHLNSQSSAESFASNTDPGDLIVGAQYLFTLGKGLLPTIAVAYDRRVRTGASPDLDIGSYAQAGVVLISGDLGHLHYDSNFTTAQQTAGSADAVQFGQSLSVTHDLFGDRFHDKLELTGELWHFTQPLVAMDRRGEAIEHANAAGVLLAGGYALRPNLILDAGFDHSLTTSSTQWQTFAGFTYLFPHRLWKNRHVHPHDVAPHLHVHRR